MYVNGVKYLNMHTQELIGNIRGRKECNRNNKRKNNEHYNITKHSSSQYQSTVTDHDSYIEVRKAPQYGTRKYYIEGSTTSYDASYRYQYCTGST